MHYTAKNALQQPQGNESGASSKPGLPLDGLSSSYTPEHSIGEKAIASPLKSDSEKEGKAALEDDQCTKRKHALQYEFSDTSSSSSSSSLEKRVRIQDGQPQLQQQRDHPNFNHTERLSVEKSNVLAPRIVTDVSSSNQTNTTTSGSGSGGNSGSNQGSSGSGNDGKGSSEEHAKDNSGDGTNGSDASTQRKVGISLGHGLGPVHRHASLTEQDTALKLAYADKHDDKGTGGRKLIDKRRKRIEMRREYEAQQEFESSGVSDTNREQYFRPGRPLSLDQVLVFSKIPRYESGVAIVNSICCQSGISRQSLLVSGSLSKDLHHFWWFIRTQRTVA